MCTVFSYEGTYSYAARNLDVAFSYNEEAVFAGKNIPFLFRHEGRLNRHFDIKGIGTRFKDIPLFYEAANEHGLFMAGLNFPGNAKYYKYEKGYINLAPWELIPYILGSFKTVEEVKKFSETLNIIDENYMANLPNAPLHYYICDKNKAIIIETTVDGMTVYDANYKTMTNNPPYPKHKEYADILMPKLSNKFVKAENKEDDCVGLGTLGLPGDSSSKSRFITAAFLAKYQVENTHNGEIMNGFRILDRVSMIKGTVKTNDGSDDYTLYSVVYDLSNFDMYYKLYDSNKVNKVDFSKAGKEAKEYFFISLEKSVF